MKTRLFHVLFAGQLVLIIVQGGCNKNAGTGPADFVLAGGAGTDFWPLTGNQTIAARATGQVVAYDSLGNVLQMQAVSNQEVKGYVGVPVVVGGVQSYPLYSYNSAGTTTSPTNACLAQSNQSIVGFAFGNSIVHPVTVLPAEISVGTSWIANPSDLPRHQVTLKLLESKSSYTNSAGKPYTNVIRVNVAYDDSTSSSSFQDTSSYFTTLQKTKINVDIYFAKGVGFVDIQINQFESLYKYTSYYSFFGSQYYYASYSRTATTGTIGRTN